MSRTSPAAFDVPNKNTTTTNNTTSPSTPQPAPVFGFGAFGGSTAAFGGGTTTSTGQTLSRTPTFFSGASTVPQSPASGSVFKSAATLANTALHLLDPVKQKRMEEFTRKFILGEELVNAQFHVFSTRSSSSRRIIRPRVLFANNLLLAKSSNYFLDLLSQDIDHSDPSLAELSDDDDVPGDIQIDDYGYGSDSDLDDDDDPAASEVQSVTPPSGTTCAETRLEDGDISSRGMMRQQALGCRQILVKDAAFQTWYTLLNYLSTGNISFLPLSSAAPGGRGGRPPTSTSTSSLDEPKCSAKSMYRLACKVGLEGLRDQALAHIRSNLRDHNILDEISCSLVSSHPQLLNMELDTLYFYIATPPVVAKFPALMRRIANKEIPHGADIMTDIHSRFLRALHPFSLSSSTSTSPAPTPAQPSLPFPNSAPRTRPIHVRLPTTTVQEPGARTENGSASGSHTEHGSDHTEQQPESTAVLVANESQRRERAKLSDETEKARTRNRSRT